MDEDLIREIQSAATGQEERHSEGSLRPTGLKDYIGQVRVKQNLDLAIQAAKAREESLDHCLFCGPPGLGKTSLAHIIANELEAQIHVVSGPAIEKKGDIAAILTHVEKRDVLFIDEIHRLNPAVEEVLYSAMEDFVLDIMVGQGPTARSIRLDLPPFTLIGATTRAGLLTNPLRDRFGILNRLEFYKPEELAKIVSRNSKILGTEIDKDGERELATRCRGTPRIANRLLRRVRDYAEIKGQGRITREVVREALKMLHVDACGLDEMDQKILKTIIETFEGGPVGIETLSAALGEERGTLEEVYEPFLIQEGFLQRTPRGRVCTPKAYQHLGFSLEDLQTNSPPQEELF